MVLHNVKLAIHDGVRHTVRMTIDTPQYWLYLMLLEFVLYGDINFMVGDTD